MKSPAQARVGSLRRLLIFAAAVCILGACASVPRSGPIHSGPVIDSGESTQFIRVVAAPPSAGASTQEIVRGFLDANVSLEQDHEIARRYLSEHGQRGWVPEDRTLIFDPSSLRLKGKGERITAELRVTGELGRGGTLKSLFPGRVETFDFRLERVLDKGGPIPQWRISSAPPGIFVQEQDVRRAFRAYDISFVASDTGLLVPDGRLVPVAGSSLPTALVQLLLSGPERWLSPAVRTGFPVGTSLSLGAVPVLAGVADVALSAEALAATDEMRRDLAAQLTWTLTQLPEVSGVRIQVDGEPYLIPGAGAPMTRGSWLARSPESGSAGPLGVKRPPRFVLDRSAIVRITSSGRTSFPVLITGANRLTRLAISLDERRAAAIASAGAGFWELPLDRGYTPRFVEATRVTDVGFAPDGTVWFTAAGRIRRLALDGRIQKIRSRNNHTDFSAARVARDGSRVAVVRGGKLFVAAVITTDTSVEIGSLHRVANSVAKIRALVWRDGSTLDMLGTLESGGSQVLRLRLTSGQVVPLGAPPGARGVAAAPGVATSVSTAAGRIFSNIGLQWRDQERGRSSAYPG